MQWLYTTYVITSWQSFSESLFKSLSFFISCHVLSGKQIVHVVKVIWNEYSVNAFPVNSRITNKVLKLINSFSSMLNLEEIACIPDWCGTWLQSSCQKTESSQHTLLWWCLICCLSQVHSESACFSLETETGTERIVL